MSRVCEDHLTLDLARLNLKPGAPRRLPRVALSWFEYQRHSRGLGYVNVHKTSWVSAAYSRAANTVRVALSESADDWTVRRSSHELNLIEAPNVIGGTRLWFECPCCERKARKLYYKRGSFACRTCAGLKHRSTVTFRTQRNIARLRSIHEELGGSGDWWTPPPVSRPRYMRRRLHMDLVAEYAGLWASLGNRLSDPGPGQELIRVARSLGWKPGVP